MGFTMRCVGEQKRVLRTDFKAEKYGDLVVTCSLLPRTWDDFFRPQILSFRRAAKGMTAQWAAKSRHFVLIESDAGLRQNPRVP
jgi:hypothetical protein